MKKIQDFQFADYLDIFRRRLLWILLLGIVSGIGTRLIVKRIPGVFVSQTTLLAEPTEVPVQLGPSATHSLESQLPMIARQIMSQPRLEKIILDNGLYPEQRKILPMQRVVEGMRRDIGLVVSKSGEGGTGSLALTFQSDEPHVAQRVMSEIASLYMEENPKPGGEVTLGDSEFLGSKLSNPGGNQDQQEAKLPGSKLHFTILNPPSFPRPAARFDREMLYLPGLLGGLAFGLALALALALLNDVVTGERELVRLTRLPVLTSIPTIPGKSWNWLPRRVRNARR